MSTYVNHKSFHIPLDLPTRQIPAWIGKCELGILDDDLSVKVRRFIEKDLNDDEKENYNGTADYGRLIRWVKENRRCFRHMNEKRLSNFEKALQWVRGARNTVCHRLLQNVRNYERTYLSAYVLVAKELKDYQTEMAARKRLKDLAMAPILAIPFFDFQAHKVPT